MGQHQADDDVVTFVRDLAAPRLRPVDPRDVARELVDELAGRVAKVGATVRRDMGDLIRERDDARRQRDEVTEQLDRVLDERDRYRWHAENIAATVRALLLDGPSGGEAAAAIGRCAAAADYTRAALDAYNRHNFDAALRFAVRQQIAQLDAETTPPAAAADDDLCPDPWHESPTQPTDPCPSCGDVAEPVDVDERDQADDDRYERERGDGFGNAYRTVVDLQA